MIQTDYKSMMKRSVDILVRFFHIYARRRAEDTHTDTHTHIRISLTPRSSADGARTPAAHTRMKVRLQAGFISSFNTDRRTR